MNEDVVYVIDAGDREAFLRLTAGEEREHFIEQFWQRRDPTPGTAVNEFKEGHCRRIGYAMKRFATKLPGWRTDRGRVYIVHGPPDEIEGHSAGRNGGPPFQQWPNRSIEGVGTRVIFTFEDSQRDGEYRLTSDPTRRKN